MIMKESIHIIALKLLLRILSECEKLGTNCPSIFLYEALSTRISINHPSISNTSVKNAVYKQGTSCIAAAGEQVLPSLLFKNVLKFVVNGLLINLNRYI